MEVVLAGDGLDYLRGVVEGALVCAFIWAWYCYRVQKKAYEEGVVDGAWYQYVPEVWRIMHDAQRTGRRGDYYHSCSKFPEMPEREAE